MDRRQFIRSTIGAGIAGTAMMAGEPSEAGVRHYVPPEEAPHELTFMQWPVDLDVYGSERFLGRTQDTIIEIANTIAAFEPVVMLADKSYHATMKPSFADGVTFWDVPTEDLWCRDSGPLIAKRADGSRVVSHIRFNGWGDKQGHRHDGRIAEACAERLGFPLIDAGLVGEPGGVDHDGHGLMIAHESSWIIDNRNPGLTKDEVTERLLRAYGHETMIWAPGLVGQDITDYHIDALARFTGPGRILMNLPAEAARDPFADTARDTHDILVEAGLNVEVISEPLFRRNNRDDFVASYVNYYVCNGAVIASHFGDRETDEAARQALARHYPDREIVMLDTDELGMIGGGIHCATQQLPAH